MADLIERPVGDLASLLPRAQREAAKYGSTFEGDAQGGHYRFRTPMGAVEGTYAVAGGVVRFAIDKKPRLLPLALIERVLDEFIGAR